MNDHFKNIIVIGFLLIFNLYFITSFAADLIDNSKMQVIVEPSVSLVKFSRNDGFGHIVRPRPKIAPYELQWASLRLNTGDYFDGQLVDGEVVDFRHIALALDFHYHDRPRDSEAAERRAYWEGRGIILTSIPGCEIRFENFGDARLSDCIAVPAGIYSHNEYYIFIVANQHHLAFELWQGIAHEPDAILLVSASVDRNSYGCSDWTTQTNCGPLFSTFKNETRTTSHVVLGDIFGRTGQYYQIISFHDGILTWDSAEKRLSPYYYTGWQQRLPVQATIAKSKAKSSALNRNTDLAKLANYELNISYDVSRVLQDHLLLNR